MGIEPIPRCISRRPLSKGRREKRWYGDFSGQLGSFSPLCHERLLYLEILAIATRAISGLRRRCE